MRGSRKIVVGQQWLSGWWKRERNCPLRGTKSLCLGRNQAGGVIEHQQIGASATNSLCHRRDTPGSLIFICWCSIGTRCPTAASITGALNALAGRLEKLGCRISRDHPKLPDLAQTARTYRQLLAASYLADLPSETIEQMNARAKTLSPDDQSYFAAVVRGLTISHADWIRQSRARVGLRARWLDLFHDINIVLCPPMPTVAFPHDHSPQFGRQLDIDGVKVPYNDQSIWAGIAILVGLPATTMPIGKSPEGLPIGAQIIGGYLEDRTTIAFAELIEREFGGFTPPPL